MAWLIIGGGVIVIVLAILLSRARVPHDGVDSFRRQIDALSPEARRPVVGQVNEARQTKRDDGPKRRPVTSVTPAGGIKRDPDTDGDSDAADGSESDRADELADGFDDGFDDEFGRSDPGGPDGGPTVDPRGTDGEPDDGS